MSPDAQQGMLSKRTVPVRLLLWSLTAADRAHALNKAQRVPARNAWDFVEIDDRPGNTCPLDLTDANELSAEQDFGWAYVIYRAEIA